jgi:hypothetical protein
MDERILFERVHEALDIEPRPGGYERLRIALAKSPAQSQRGQAFEMRWSNMGLKFAAGFAVVALAAAIVAAFVATHRATDETVPGGTSLSIEAYQKLQADDYATAAAAWSQPCDTTTHVGCLGDATRSVVALQNWLDDLDRSQPPARFSVVDAQLRAHLTESISGLQALLAADQAGDSNGIDRAYGLAIAGRQWTDTMMPAIANSKQVNGAVYVGYISRNVLTGCITCQDLAGNNPVVCWGSEAPSCQALVEAVAGQVAAFQAALVEIAAPDSLSAKDTRLQQDLAQADTALIAMQSALTTGDQAGFNAGQTTLHRALAAVDQDSAAISNG